MAADTELWPLRLKVIDVARRRCSRGSPPSSARASASSPTPSPSAPAPGSGADAYPTLLAGVAGVAMRTALHRWLASDFTAALPDLVDEAWDLLTAGLPAPPR